MSRRKLSIVLFGLGALIAALVVTPFVLLYAKDRALAGRLAKELVAARAAGIPTSPMEFRETLPEVKPENNAAPILVELAKVVTKGKLPTFKPLARSLLFDAKSDRIDEARTTIRDNAGILRLVEAAAEKPSCRFERDWELGIGVPYPEFGPLLPSLDLLAIRAAIAARDGEPRNAIRDLSVIERVGKLVGQEPGGIPQIVALATQTRVTSALVGFIMLWPNEIEYRVALRRAIDHSPTYDRRLAHGLELPEALATTDLLATEEGRKKLGIEGSASTKFDTVNRIGRLMQSSDAGKALLIAGMRRFWEAVENPTMSQARAIREARQTMRDGLSSFPGASKLLGIGGADDTIAFLFAEYQAKRVQNEAIWRIFGEGDVPTMIKTDDLISPYDGKPIRYVYKQGRVELSLGKAPWRTSEGHATFPPREKSEPVRERR